MCVVDGLRENCKLGCAARGKLAKRGVAFTSELKGAVHCTIGLLLDEPLLPVAEETLGDFGMSCFAGRLFWTRGCNCESVTVDGPALKIHGRVVVDRSCCCIGATDDGARDPSVAVVDGIHGPTGNVAVVVGFAARERGGPLKWAAFMFTSAKHTPFLALPDRECCCVDIARGTDACTGSVGGKSPVGKAVDGLRFAGGKRG